MADNELLQKLVDSKYSLVHIKTDDVERLLDIFQRFNHETGCAVYKWNKNCGLHRVGFEHILIPRTISDSDLATYIRTARHFGIYFLTDFQEALDKDCIQKQIIQMSQSNDGVRRLLAVIGNDVQIPETLKNVTCTIKHGQKPIPKPQENIHTFAAASGY